MSSLKIEIPNLRDMVKELKDLPANIEKQVISELKAFGMATVKDAQTNLSRPYPDGATDEGHLKSSISYTLTKNGNTWDVEIVVATNYAAYIEFGTRKFAAAYVASLPPDWRSFAAQFKGGTPSGSIEEMLQRITAWVMRKGFAAYKTKSGNNSKSKNSVQAQESAAYIIALRILQNGVRAHPFLYPAVIKNKPILIENLNKLLA